MQKIDTINEYQITENDVERTKALAHIMVSKWEPGLICFEDVLGDGLEGLTRAAQLFDASKGKHFWAYATPAVRGYMLNGFRRRFGEKRQKLAMARAESLNITEDDDPNYKPVEIEAEDNTQITQTGMLWSKINDMNLGPAQKRIMWLMSQGYTQADIARMTGKSDGNVCNAVQAIKAKFTKNELCELLG